MARHTTHSTTPIKHHTGIKPRPAKRTVGVAPASAQQPGGVIRRGILTSFDPTTYTCSVLLLEATNTYLQSVPIAYHMDGTSALVNNFCAVLFFDEQNYTDALIIAIYPGAGTGGPAYLPGRTTLIPLWTFINSVTIPNGNTNTYTVTGSNHIPTNALAVFISAYFTSVSTATFVQLSAHGSIPTSTLGNLYTVNGFINASSLLPVDSSGRIDIKANNGDCVVTANIYGYII